MHHPHHDHQGVEYVLVNVVRRDPYVPWRAPRAMKPKLVHSAFARLYLYYRFYSDSGASLHFARLKHPAMYHLQHEIINEMDRHEKPLFKKIKVWKWTTWKTEPYVWGNAVNRMRTPWGIAFEDPERPKIQKCNVWECIIYEIIFLFLSDILFSMQS